MAASPEHLFAAWVQATALGYSVVAQARDAELGRLSDVEAREYFLALRLVRPS